MAILRWVRPKLGIQGFLAVLAVLAGLVMGALARLDIPFTIVLSHWAPTSLFAISPTLQIDDIAWYFSLALISISFTTVFTSIARSGQTIKPTSVTGQNNLNHIDEGESNQPAKQDGQPAPSDNGVSIHGWLLWVIILLITSLGLLAVGAANLLTLLLAWVAIDLVEIPILMGHTLRSDIRERISIVFSSKMISFGLVIAAALILWALRGSLNISDITYPASVLLILAAGFRLVSIPLQFPLRPGSFMRSELATILYLAPAASSYILLVRLAPLGINESFSAILLFIILLIGIISAIRWLSATDEQSGSAGWMVGSASLVIGAALLRQPLACLAWSLASLLSAGLLFSMFIRRRSLIPLIILGIFNLSTLPFSPSWQATSILQSPSNLLDLPFLFTFASIVFLLIQSLLLAGFIRHSLRGVYPSAEDKSQHIEQWVWVVYPVGLAVIALTHLVIGWLIVPQLGELSLFAWISGPLTMIVASLLLFITWRAPQPFSFLNRYPKILTSNKLLPHGWFYSLSWQFYKAVSRLIGLFSTILEGDGGILWALVLFALIFVFMQK